MIKHLAVVVMALALFGCSTAELQTAETDFDAVESDVGSAESSVCADYERYKPAIDTVEVIGAVVPFLGSADALVEAAQPQLDAFCNAQGNLVAQADAAKALYHLEVGLSARAPAALAKAAMAKAAVTKTTAAP